MPHLSPDDLTQMEDMLEHIQKSFERLPLQMQFLIAWNAAGIDRYLNEQDDQVIRDATLMFLSAHRAAQRTRALAQH
jgi:hypothetical protein